MVGDVDEIIEVPLAHPVAMVDEFRSSGILFISVNGRARPNNGELLVTMSDYEALYDEVLQWRNRWHNMICSETPQTES